MPNIRSLNDSLKSDEKRKRIGGIVIIALLLLSTLGFAISMIGFGSNGSNNKEVQGFSNNGQYWIYTAGSRKYYFTHHVDEINYTFDISKSLSDFSNTQLYIDSNIPGALQEIYTNLGPYASKVSEACYGNCERDIPEKNCSTPGALIVMKEDKQEKISENQSCIFINGNMKTVDAFLYKILAIS